MRTVVTQKILLEASKTLQSPIAMQELTTAVQTGTFRKDRSPLDQREYNQGPRNGQATEQNDVRRQADVRVRQINYCGGGQSNRNARMQGWPRDYRARNSNSGRRRHTQDGRSRDFERRRLDPRANEFEPRDDTARRTSQPVSLQTNSKPNLKVLTGRKPIDVR